MARLSMTLERHQGLASDAHGFEPRAPAEIVSLLASQQD